MLWSKRQPASTRRPGTSEGFTLVELLTVMVVIGILLAVAVPAYAGFRDQANRRAAESEVRDAVPAAEAFYAANGTYVGLGNGVKKTPPGIAAYEGGLKATVATGKGKPTASTYCLTATSGGKTVSLSGPGAVAWYQTATCTGASSRTAP